MVIGWNQHNPLNIQIIAIFVVIITYFVGGIIALIQNNRKGMLSIFIVNSMAFIPLLTFFLLYSYGYFTHPCYIEPASCDDQLTDAPFELKALGVWTTILALFTYMSWRLQRAQKIDESNEIEDKANLQREAL